MLFSIVLGNLFCTSLAFIPAPSRLTTKYGSDKKVPSALMGAPNPDKTAFGSKLLPDFTEEELQEMFKEFNITNFDLNKDPELAKWAPSKEFFEKFGFQNMTERYSRTTSDVKTAFYAKYRRPILPQYKTFIADMMTVAFIQV